MVVAIRLDGDIDSVWKDYDGLPSQVWIEVRVRGDAFKSRLENTCRRKCTFTAANCAVKIGQAESESEGEGEGACDVSQFESRRMTWPPIMSDGLCVL